MKFIVIVKANKESEAGVMPTQEGLSEMGQFNEQLMNAGMFLDGAGVEASSHGTRIYYDGGTPNVVQGPFIPTEDLLAGYWLLKANSQDEVVNWLKRAPFPSGQVEIRRLFELEDFEPGVGIDKARELADKLEQQKASA